MNSIITVATIISSALSASWDYHDFDFWSKLYPECGGRQQSPIDIPTTNTCTNKDPLSLHWNIDTSQTRFMIKNAGHSLKGVAINNNGKTLNSKNDTIAQLTNLYQETYSVKQDTHYCLDSFHFHWGFSNVRGSEHTFDGKTYPLEIHFVHYSCDYNNLGDALNAYTSDTTGDNSNILAVVGVLFEIGESNSALDAILANNVMDSIKYYNDTISISEPVTLAINELIPTNTEYYGYFGSLTTPPCYETVLWHVLKNTLTVSKKQLQQFRKLFDTNNEMMADNWRPVQTLYDRNIFECDSDINALKNEELGKVTDSSDEQTTIIVLSVLLGVSLLILGAIIVKVFVCPKIKKNNGKAGFRKDTESEKVAMVEVDACAVEVISDDVGSKRG